MSADTESLTAAIGRRLRAIAARFRHPAKQKGGTRAEFDLNMPDVSPEHAKATDACLPIGPCCC
jgi:hypothetical protein